MPSMKFNFRQIAALSEDFESSRKALPIIVRRVLVEHLRPLRSALRGMVPRASGRLQRSFGFSQGRKKPGVFGSAHFGFLIDRRTPTTTIIAGNVLQHGGATPKKGKYLWIPLPGNRTSFGNPIVTPSALLGSFGFVKMSKAGNLIAFERVANEVRPMFVLKKSMNIGAPIPIEARTEAAAKQIADDIPVAIAQIIAAKQAAIGAISG